VIHDDAFYVILNVENPSFMQVRLTNIDNCDMWREVINVWHI